ncbi:MAG: ferredoxin III, nif-specific [Zetaproteobacteria bacterium CG06_land_8_20_14_3_00_59_53]|nr:MAG: ferredoxin III, nif-specific [Zetaproteobacteria bacterium CG2_30_59_37]PIO90542.1 MAG: ferredoxin III, nif-specific [Zetaproteobacteria bacterium CG23_combo_of_CG06-09_8_20_14_all_59_86]PIQ66011.1 MAG: ferredoxin III, nif-specific [Zetaproteobacteria bacterium CG11_big_fil_rev_8_21_14_0_20_59_439]PIU71491.1 MAG: ferredoxin III, nif-specific [Zetaproteobacteria bacterium CG06_land_8_20_14_3_00_59_53]PIU97749.1 MAG: ferredoxin III, nif-specific [Zetaproteobacteria bacterium CG03_land_8_2
MSDIITGITRSGETWTPEFVTGLDQSTCIGCGRCFKVCPREVFDLVERELDDSDYDDGYEDIDDDVVMVMSIRNAMDCIGCSACSRVCPKNCHTHSPQAVGT